MNADKRRLEIPNNSFDFRLRLTEVDEQANVHPGGLQVVQALRRMHVIQSFCHFEFDQNCRFDKQIGGEFTDDHTVIPYLNRVLLANLEARLAELVSQSVLVDLFEKTGAEFVGDPVDTPDDLPGELIQLQSAFICVHRRLSFLWSAADGSAEAETRGGRRSFQQRESARAAQHVEDLQQR